MEAISLTPAFRAKVAIQRGDSDLAYLSRVIVENGALVLDGWADSLGEQCPDLSYWREFVDVESLDISCPRLCVVGQATRAMPTVMGWSDAPYGVRTHPAFLDDWYSTRYMPDEVADAMLAAWTDYLARVPAFA